MYELKPIHASAIPAALKKAERYRLLNEPHEAESICRDILAIAPDNAEAQAALVLALTDEFNEGHKATLTEALERAAAIQDEYQRTYLTGLVHERWGKELLAAGAPAETPLYWLREALAHYERANHMAHEGNDDPLLRWNACVRLIQSDPRLQTTTAARTGLAQSEIPLE